MLANENKIIIEFCLTEDLSLRLQEPKIRSEFQNHYFYDLVCGINQIDYQESKNRITKTLGYILRAPGPILT